MDKKDIGGGISETVEYSQPGWTIRSDSVELFITKTGGHTAPITFFKNTDSPLMPYYISPWQNEKHEQPIIPMLDVLRGDFFCMPFGGNGEPVDGEQHGPHGETAAKQWNLVDFSQEAGATTLTLDMQTIVRPGKVTKTILLVDGHDVVYTSHLLQGFTGAMPLGHHATLDVPETEGSMKLAISPFDLGMTSPSQVGDPAAAEYQALAIGAQFDDLARVPTLWKDPAEADCSTLPARTGFTEVIQVFRKPTGTPAWATVACEERGFLWFSLKDIAVLPGTVIWISNKGRHSFPWNGRNRCLAIEETCSYFADGLAPSIRPNEITEAGFPTAISLNPDEPKVINYIQGAVRIPAGFDRVKDVRFDPGTVTFISTTGTEVTAAVDHDFLKTG